MGRIGNVSRLVKEDFDQEYSEMIDKVAFVVNGFMEDVERQINGNLDDDNLRSDTVTFSIKVDDSGTPIDTDIVKTGVSKANGLSVISARNADDTSVYPTSHPFISFGYEDDTSVIKILNIIGLQANATYSLVVKVY